MRRPDFWTIALPLGLVAVPALAAQSQRDMSNDCFDVAAPMADATPCFEPGRHAHHHHHAHHDRNETKIAAKKVRAASGDTPKRLLR
ncbi:hypothetical protein SOM26_00770 [Sphingomonas sp. CFBP8993]|uniref:hypothetical protein n=1 Tax=Sphingomonas sp. CFBP8993 TaxID=3096526 RepID=UPI002A6AC050|nr:hypothetical protein [Sphingomonas sp. CFBP8993]MDY0957210.1 hypothetical protein [Sphingomonas sp. CFBP8993]